MPKPSVNLDVNVLVSVSKRFITDKAVKAALQNKYDWNTPGLRFSGRTVSKTEINGVIVYDVLLDDLDAHIKVAQGSLKYMGRITSTNIEPEVLQQERPENNELATEDLLENAVDDDFSDNGEKRDESGENIKDVDSRDGWRVGEIYIDSRLGGNADGYSRCTSKFTMTAKRYGSPLDYFLFFLPVGHIYSIIRNTNMHARSLGHWVDISFNEYLMWISLLTVMTVVRHSDKKAYWRQGESHFFLNTDFSKYMSFTRFNDIMRMHVFEIPSRVAQAVDPLYQIRSTIEAFNDHMTRCIIPGKYLVIDESMNQWLGTGMPNLKKVPRKPHPIGQEFKTLGDYDTSCILRMDTVSDPCSKEFDDEGAGSKKKTLTATVKRLVKPWFGSGRTIIADSWFGSPKMVSTLMNVGLYSIMQVVKRAHWPRGMPETDIVLCLDKEYGSCFTMKKDLDSGRIFVCHLREKMYAETEDIIMFSDDFPIIEYAEKRPCFFFI